MACQWHARAAEWSRPQAGKSTFPHQKQRDIQTDVSFVFGMGIQERWI